MSEGAASRASAVRAVASVLGKGQTLEAALACASAASGDRALAQALSFGALRFGHRLARVAGQLLTRPWTSQSAEVQALLLVGLYQLEYGAAPPHAAVSTTVEAARAVGAERAAGLINACLRRFQRQHDELLATADATLAGRTSHPEWLVEALKRDWPAEAWQVLEADNEHPPLVLRANLARTTVPELAAELADSGIESRPVPFAPAALVLARPLDVTKLAAFSEGRCSVQDAAAQLAAPLLGARAGERVLDACAAPGGKTCHLLEGDPGLAELVALDVAAERCERIRANLDRLGLRATVRTGDATDPATLGEERFERILVDAPCSGTGVIRRHPDIKWLRRPGDIPGLAARQRRLLDALWPALAPSGRLVYATCSVLAAENAAVVAAFLASTPGAVDVTESASLAVPGLPTLPAAGPGLVLLPGTAGTDGFYYACLERRAR